MNKIVLTLTLIALPFGVASAQTSTVSAQPGQLPPSVTRTMGSDLQKLLSSGGSVQLLDSKGTVIGTLNADGTAQLNAGATLAQVTSVRVNVPNSDPKTFTLASSLDKAGAIKLEWTQPNGKKVNLPLPAIVNRQAEQHAQSGTKATDATKTPDQDENDDQDKADETRSTDQQAHPVKPAHPDKPVKPGKGHK